MIQEDYASFELTRVLKQKGYPLVKVVKDNGDKPLFYDLPKDHPNWNDCDAWYIPTLWEVHQWLMAKQGIFVHVWMYRRMPDCTNVFNFAVEDMLLERGRHTNLKDYSEYPIALQDGIVDALELIENKTTL